ncbi:MAG: hypothetical protein P9X24_05080 [Candidatus Hatepunaea meridiana]|nr:hypothetical protein [Candidatus Hatepunaea meridiana]
MSHKRNSTKVDESTTYTLVDFFQRIPPGRQVQVTQAFKSLTYNRIEIKSPELQLYCDNCKGLRFFDGSYGTIPPIKFGEYYNIFFNYFCRNCEISHKIFAVRVHVRDKEICHIVKLGEIPSFGPPVPNHFLTLIGDDSHLFLSGRQCENQGFGIGACAYYRRIVDQQWQKLISEILRVSKGINADKEIITTLESSLSEHKFKRAVEIVKDAIPPVLLINGHNPITFLYSSTSRGIHELTDSECLEIATSIRTVLVELSIKIKQALSNKRELIEAMNKLNSKKKSKQ